MGYSLHSYPPSSQRRPDFLTHPVNIVTPPPCPLMATALVKAVPAKSHDLRVLN